MSHPEQRAFVELAQSCFPEFFSGRKVLEIGSFNVNGTVRDFFSTCDYAGIDIRGGPGVDVVASGHEYKAPDGSFDVVISCECMEHNPYWAKTLENAVRMLRPGGLCVITCAAPGRKEHGTTRSETGSSALTEAGGWEYYRNLDARDFSTVAAFWGEFDRYGTWKNYRSFDFYFTGLKRADPGSLSPEISADWDRYMAAVQDWVRAQNEGSKPRMKRLILSLVGEAGFEKLRRLVPTD